MNVASATRTAISHGLTEAGFAAAGAPKRLPTALIPSPPALRGRLESLIQERRRIDSHGRHDRHAGAEGDIGRRMVDDDLDRHALDDLDVVASGVLGRQQRERRAGPGLDAGDVAAEVAIRIGVDLDPRRLARPHVIELGLLKVRDYPDVVRHEHGERGPGRGVFADRGGEVDHMAGLVGDDRGIGKVQPRLVALGVGLLDIGLRARALSLERLHLPLRQLERRLRVVDCGLLGF